MKTYQAVTLAMVAGFGLGAAAIQGLHAQSKPPAFYVAMNDVKDRDHYLNDFVAKSTPIITSAGGHFLVRGGAVTALKGEAPKSRIVLIQFANMDKLQAWWKSSENTETQKIGDKYATIHSFAVEGVPQ